MNALKQASEERRKGKKELPSLDELSIEVARMGKKLLGLSSLFRRAAVNWGVELHEDEASFGIAAVLEDFAVQLDLISTHISESALLCAKKKPRDPSSTEGST